MSDPTEQEDVRLMCRAREGDVEAFALLYQRHRRRVEGFLYRLFWDREKAEDGVQEVFLKLWLARQRYEPRARFTTYLYRVARNYWVDELRKAEARPPQGPLPNSHDPLPGQGVPLAPASTEPLAHLFVRYRQHRIREAIARLPEIYRVVFVLAHLEERKLAEIAEILELPLGTVKSRLHAAVRLLREWLTAEEQEAGDAM